jgi:hypothetical protein
MVADLHYKIKARAKVFQNIKSNEEKILQRCISKLHQLH